MMINRCPIIPIEQHQVYYHRVNTKILEGLYNVRFPKYVLDLAMCYAKLKIIVEKTPAMTCINKFCKTREVCTAFKKHRILFLDWG